MEKIEKNLKLNKSNTIFYKNLVNNNTSNDLEYIYLSLILQKKVKDIIQIGDISEKYETFIKKNHKINYKKINNNFLTEYALYKYNFNQDVLIIGNFKNPYHLLYNSNILKNVKYIFYFYQYNNINHNHNSRKFLNNNYFYSIGKKYLVDDNLLDKSVYVKKNYLECEIFSKGKINGLREELKLSHKKEIIDRSSIINHLISKFKLKKYLEIGVRDGSNFKKIMIKDKTAVDPEPTDEIKNDSNVKVMTSDDYFDSIKNSNQKFDIIFIDGLHLEYQVDNDIKNSLNYLNDNGFIIMHDCNPPTKFHQRTNYELKNGQTPCWNGTVWRSYVKLRMNNSRLNMCAVNCDWGIGIIQKGKQRCIKKNKDFRYNYLDSDRVNVLNLISVYDFLQKF